MTRTASPRYALGPAAVIDRVVRLHRRDDPQFGEASVILRPQMLDIIDPKTVIAGAVLLRPLRKQVEHLGVAAVADGVNRDCQPRAVGFENVRPQLAAPQGFYGRESPSIRTGKSAIVGAQTPSSPFPPRL